MTVTDIAPDAAQLEADATVAAQAGGVASARVVRVVRETEDAVSLELEPEAGHAGRFGYKPGQFLTLRIPSELTGSVSRCYSLSSAPHEGGLLKITVKRTVDGYGSNWLCDNAVEGMSLDVLPPAGLFTPSSLDADLLLFGGGSGITPVLSILKSVLAEGTGRCTLIYANQHENSVIFAEELAELAAAHPDRLLVLHWLQSVQGLPTVDQLAALAKPWASREVFVCGPGPFMDAVSVAMASLGADRKRVHVEKFVSLSGNPFETDTATVDIEAAAEAGDNATVQVALDGENHEFTWPRQQVLLDVLLAKGLEAPYSCREGACSACVCRVVSGEVSMRRNEVLEDEDLADGYVLACQAIPVTDDVTVTYD
ncbi:ferredoxin--NADP reductase [Nocardia huaxiensis]|uniref:3-ketosteroid-9-alpha-monooxygenase, ferredoxin reductase component n=1 Tax=Nocardia huaxiensis TaxID=2755382 RepID=A0A7D6Z9C3_9NOCA|nr:ferredoxin--NADP reductase [Nocardia huaxiensis]QLY30168.1 ferredoxin--NADP reductase [Nocardia huaxiensis]UFS96217.1 ferredoxin--NADP reductase [Nocardia huaxiensis]